MTNTFAEAIVALGRSPELSLVVNATLILLSALLINRLAANSRASRRHIVLAVTFGGLLVLPATFLLLPATAIEVSMPATTSPAAVNAVASQPVAAPGASLITPDHSIS